jgi:hypothetical protein
MAQGDLQAAEIKWRARANASRQRGIPDSAWAGIAKQDLANVAQGHTAMADSLVNDAILGAMRQSPVQNPQPSHSSPLDIFGNIGSDVRDIVTGFIPGTVGYVASLPQQMGDFVDLTGLEGQDAQTHAQQKYGMETSGGPAAFIRDMARTPVFATWIPGLHTAAELTSDQGRQQLEEHPIGTALDVLPVAAEGGKLATAGLSEGEQFSVREALQQGKPAKAAYRAAMDTASKIPRVNRIESLDRAHVRQWASDHALLPSQIVDKFMHPLGEISSETTMNLQDFIEQPGGILDSMSKMSDTELRTFTDAINGTGVPIESLPEEQQVLVGQYNQFKDQIFNESQSLAHPPVQILAPDGKLHVYAADDPVVKAHEKMVKEQTKLDRGVQEHQGILADVRKRQADYQGLHDKMRKMGESDADFAAREAGPVTNQTILQDSAPFIDSFAHLDPTQVYNQVLEAPARYRPQLLSDMEKLGGENGLVAQWADALRSEDYKTASRTLTQIQSLLRDHKSWSHTPYARAFKNHLNELRRVTTGLDKSQRSLGHRGRLLAKSLKLQDESRKSLERQHLVTTNAHQEFVDTATKRAPAEFQPLLLKHVRERGATEIKNLQDAHMISAEQASAALKGIEESSSITEFSKYVMGGEQEAKQWIDEAQRSWVELSKSGVNPIFVHSVDPSKLEYVAQPRVLPDRLDRAGFTRGRIFTMGDSVHNVRASIVDMKQQLLSEMGTKRFVDDVMKPQIESEADIAARIRKAVQTTDSRFHTRREMYDVNATVKREMDKHYVEFDPAKYGFTKYYQSPAGKKMMIPKGYDVALSKMTTPSGLPFKGVLDPTMKLWRFAVLTTPRHMAHIALGGAVMGALQEGPRWFAHLGRGLKIARGEDNALKAKLSLNVNDVNSMDHYDFAAGKSLGRMLGEVAGGPVRFLNKWENNIAGMYKAAAMLTEEAKGADREMALRQANKVFVDMNALTPFERTTMRQIMPFYGFARHIFRYLFTFPSDHPLRAAVLANFARIESESFNQTGLPGTMKFLFFIGGTDAQGNRTGIDYRSLDPFRSYFNDFSLAGITSQLNPVLQFGLQEMGVNTLSATPELYPGMHYDPYTGSMQADRPSSPLMSGLETLIPETNTLDAMLSISDQYKNLARTDPNAFRKRLYTSLGIPFGPTTENIPLDIQRQQTKRYKDADSAASAAIQSGDFSHAKQYSYVPLPSIMQQFFPGVKYVTPAALEDAYNKIRAHLDATGQQGVSVHAILPKPRTVKQPLL